MKPRTIVTPVLQALAIGMCLSAGLPAQPNITVPVGPPPWNSFSVQNTDRILFEFERTTGTPTDTSVPMALPGAGATFTIEKDGSPCATADPANCSGSDVSVPSGAFGEVFVMDDGETPGTSVFRVLVVGTFGNWQVNPTTNADIMVVHTVPWPTINYPAEVPSGQTGVTLDASPSVATYEPAAAAPSLTYSWTPPVGITLSSLTAADPTFDAPTVTSDEDKEFALTVNDGVFSADATAIVTVGAAAKPVDAILLVDTSGSMGWHRTGSTADLQGGCCSRLASAKSAARDFVGSLGLFDPDSRLGVAIFPGEPYPSTVYARRFTPATGLAEVVDFPGIESDIGAESITCGNCLTIPGSPGSPTGIPINWNGTPTRPGLAEAQTMLTDASLPGEKSRIVVLLSDGAWNRPPGDDPADPTFLSGLVADEIHVYTVGMGTGTDNVNHASLQDISVGTGVGTAVDPIGFTTFNLGDASETNLVPFFEKIMTDMVDLDFIADPHGRIRPGGTKTHPVVISDHDTLVSFTVSWESSRADLLDFHVQAPDCKRLKPQTSGGGYKNLTVAGDLLRAPAPGDPCDWQLVVNYPGSGSAELSYNYSVITRSSLNMKVRLDKDRIFTGDELVIEARLIEDNRRLRDGEVEVTVRRPKSAIGNWHFVNRVQQEQLERVPTEISGEPLTRVDRKNYVLRQMLKVALPGIFTVPTLELNDEGKDGDRYPDDGIYAGRFTDFSVPGVYEFHLVATGVATNGQPYRRQRTVQKFVDMVPDPAVTEKEAAIESVTTGGAGVIRVSVTPLDGAGNYLGPGYDQEIEITSSLGNDKGPVKDLLFGAYQRRFDLTDVTADPRIVITARGVTVYDGPFSELREARYRWELSFHLGRTDPQGTLGRVVDNDGSAMVDLGYRFTRSWSAELLLGYHRFSGPNVDLDVLQTSVNWKYSYPVGLFRLFGNGGIGYYDPDLGDSGFGWNLGGGLTYPFNDRASLDLSYNYHEMTEGAEYEFSTLHLGFRWAFSRRR